ncbi:MAG: glycosyl hydrolase [Planctomycetia bacterium]|nr:glycosyl hydrolase [Planctomycetia bacterium]
MNILSMLLTLALVSPGTLTPASLEQFYVEPNQAAVLEFSGKPKEGSEEFKIYNSDGKMIASGKGNPKDKGISVPVNLPQGYYELEFPSENCRFGILSFPAFKPKPDPFFAIDGALSWLVKSPEKRSDLVKIARRSGISMIRGRLRWSEIEPKQGEFIFDGSRSYHAVQEACLKNGVEFLEVIHDAPDWTGKVGKFPKDLVKTSQSWKKMAEERGAWWNALEVWNEPDISFSGKLPADQYTPLLKTIQRTYKANRVKIRVVGGVLSGFNKDWMESAKKNGLADHCDVFSFHTYSRANAVEGIFSRYQGWLADCGTPGKELWLTECGRPWKRGTDRPSEIEDRISAIDITMKGVEAKACKIDRYFPFVYPYYEERDNNFGMLGKNLAPLRSFAGYSVLIRSLSGKGFIGDLNNLPPGTEKARVFGNAAGEKTIVFYQSNPTKGSRILLPGKPLQILRITGEMLTMDQKNEADFSDGFLLVSYQPQFARFSIRQNSGAYRINAERTRAQAYPKTAQNGSPIVLSYLYDTDWITPSPNGYLIRKDAKKLHLILKATNISDMNITANFSFIKDGVNVPSSEWAVKNLYAKSAISIPFEISDVSSLSDFKPLEFIFAVRSGGHVLDALVLKFTKAISLDHIAKYPLEVKKIDLSDLKNWKKNLPACAKSEFFKKEELKSPAAWGFKASFGECDRWIYPIFTLPADLDLSQQDGILIRAKCKGSEDTAVRIFCVEEDGESFISNGSLIAPDGQWNDGSISFDKMGLIGKFKNGKLDRGKIKKIYIGCNTKGKDLDLQVADFYFYQKKNEKGKQK